MSTSIKSALQGRPGERYDGSSLTICPFGNLVPWGHRTPLYHCGIMIYVAFSLIDSKVRNSGLAAKSFAWRGLLLRFRMMSICNSQLS